MKHNLYPKTKPERLIRAKEAKALLGISSDTTLWRWINEGKLPRPRYLNTNRVWAESEFQLALEEMVSDTAPVTVLSNEGAENDQV